MSTVRILSLAALLPALGPSTADAAPTFPLKLIGSECYVGANGGMCTPSLRFTLNQNGTVTSDAGDGTWFVLQGTFTMTLTSDWDGDGRPDNRKDYLGTLDGRCVTGAVRDSSIPVVGEFDLCPRG